MGTLHNIVLAGLVAAAEEGGHGAHGAGGGSILSQLGIQFPLIIAQAVGFVLLIIVLKAFLYRPVLTVLSQREEEIRTRYSDADKARGTAEDLRREYENRLSQIEAEARDRIHDGIREGQAMRAELVAQAQQERERIIQQGHREVADEREKMVFTGDTLFAGGCGRLFEGDAAMMIRSLSKLMSLPTDTRVYFGHEYTEKNLRFALTLEPNNEALREKHAWAVEQNRRHVPTTPTTIAAEKATNPFLRWDSVELRATLQRRFPDLVMDDESVFATTRALKDEF